MRNVNRLTALAAIIAFLLTTFAQGRRGGEMPGPEASSLNLKIARFAPTVLTADTARLAPNDRKALQKIIAAAKLYDQLYLRQIWSGNESLLKKLEADKTLLGRLRL